MRARPPFTMKHAITLWLRITLGFLAAYLAMVAIVAIRIAVPHLSVQDGDTRYV